MCQFITSVLSEDEDEKILNDNSKDLPALKPSKVGHVLENRNVEPRCSVSTVDNLSDSNDDRVNNGVNNENVYLVDSAVREKGLINTNTNRPQIKGYGLTC